MTTRLKSILFTVILLKSVIKRIFISLACGSLFFCVVYGYLYHNLNKTVLDIGQKDYSVPYRHVPENKGIGFLLPDNSAVLVYLEFEKNCIDVINVENYDKDNDLYYGYTMDYTVEVTERLIGGIVDNVGGVNVRIGEKTLRYTGVQVEQLIANTDDEKIKRQIISEIFRQISKNGFSKESFLYILQNAKTNLSITDCIYWLDYINEIRKNINFID